MNESRGSPGASLRDRHAGFLMLELLLALAVMALIVALALPFARAAGQAGLRGKAVEIASLLRSSRNAALLSGRPSVVTVDAAAGVVRSRLPPGIVAVPRGIVLATQPTQSPGAAAIEFSVDGRSSGGAITLSAGRNRLIVRVNPLTAAVDLSGS